jgi:hypothetical protein
MSGNRNRSDQGDLGDSEWIDPPHLQRRDPVEEPDGPVLHRQKIKVEATSIKCSSSAAWQGDEGEILAEAGDGYRVHFTNGFVAKTIKECQIKEA